MYQEILNQVGLSQNQAEIYELLLKGGPQKAGEITQKSPLQRGLVYKVLDELIAFGLVEKEEEAGKVAVFKPSHPMRLKDLAENREQEAKDAQRVLDGVIPSLISDFNLISDRPGVQFFEGIDAFRRITDDSLTAKGEIYSVVDSEAINTYIAKENAQYAAKRDSLGIKKKVITMDGQFIRDYVKKHPNLTDVRLIDSGTDTFDAVMMMYDNKVSYLTLHKNAMVGVLISDPWIYKMHKLLFEVQWNKATPLGVVNEGLSSNTIPTSD